MGRRKPVTAAELKARLSKDPKHLAGAAERERRIAEQAREYADEDKQIAHEAAELEYDIESVWDFVNNNPHPFLPRSFAGAYDRAYPLLVRHLRLQHHRKVREGIIRALTVKDGGPLVSEALYREFAAEKDPHLQWVLANALRTAMPLKDRKRHPEIAKVFNAKGSLSQSGRARRG
jgi:hypothetical protein